MSLLLEALKKAEKAKEEAQRRAREERPSERPSGEPEELRSEGETSIEIIDASTDAQVPPALLTRDKLPEISPKLEIMSDDLLDKPAAAPAPEPMREAAPRMSNAAMPREEAREAREAASRASARKVFEAKFREPNPRLPFFITLGVLGAFGVSTLIYFWIQLRPPSPLVNANPQRQAEAPVATMESRPAQSVETPTSGAIPGLPGATPASTPPPAPTLAPIAQPTPAAPRVAEAQPAAPTAAPVRKPAAIGQLAPRASAAQPASTVEPTTPRVVPSVHPKVDSAYAAYLSGNLELARGDYQQALNEDPGNRDALLGMAAIDVRGGRFESAEAGYLRLLQADPRDSEAQAALMALRSGRVDPLAAESRLKSMLAADPRAHALNFALGNQLAQQGRWAEAQAQYFKAFAAEPNNPDFAYNLAVSLDHLRQPKQALEYYKHAIALARARGASFDVTGAEARVAQLTR